MPNGSSNLQFSGANNSVFIVSQNNTLTPVDKTWTHNNNSISELKGDKQPIGFHLKMSAFSKKEINLAKGDSIYMTSDGFPDQFGGPRNKKFMMKNFRMMLCDVQHLSFVDQKSQIEETLNQHMGDFAQIDDICMIGVKI
jgi:serine phosphatase RsbU (regulator of sigma subunit)